MEIDGKKVAMLFEYPEIYDGWSVVEFEDGTFMNRWDPTDYPRRYELAQAHIEGLTRQTEVCWCVDEGCPIKEEQND